MSNGLPYRVLKFLTGVDEAFNALLGGTQRETISGTVGRALEAHKPWAPAARWVIDGIFGQGHCLAEAAKEAARRAAEGQ